MSTRRVPTEDQTNLGRSIDNLTGQTSSPRPSSLNITHAYINTAFNFFKRDDFGPYKYYDEDQGWDPPDGDPEPSQATIEEEEDKPDADIYTIYDPSKRSSNLSTKKDKQLAKKREHDARTIKICLLALLVVVVISALILGLVYKFVIAKTDNTSPEERIFIGELTLVDEWSEDLRNSGSEVYIALEAEVKTHIDSILSSSDSTEGYIYQSRILGFRPGSIVVDFKFTFFKNSKSDANQTLSELTEEGLEETLQLGFKEKEDNSVLSWHVTDIKLTKKKKVPTATLR